MLRNISGKDVTVKWDGKEHVVPKGFRITFASDPAAELRVSQKNPGVFAYVPPPVRETQSVIIEEDIQNPAAPIASQDQTASQSGDQTSSGIEEEAHTPESDADAVFGCGKCAFIAKTAAGLQAHERARHPRG